MIPIDQPTTKHPKDAAAVLAWRQRMDWSQEMAAAQLGMSHRGYQLLERGQVRFRRPLRLACAFLETRAHHKVFVPTLAEQMANGGDRK